MNTPTQPALPVNQDFQHKLQTPTALVFQDAIEKLGESITQLGLWETRLARVIKSSGGKLFGVDDPASKSLEDLKPIHTFRVAEANVFRTTFGYRAVSEADYQSQTTAFKEIEKQYKITLGEYAEAQRTFKIAKERGLDMQRRLTQQQEWFLGACDTHSQEVFQLQKYKEWASPLIPHLQNNSYCMQSEINRLKNELQSSDNSLRAQLNTVTHQLETVSQELKNTQEQIRVAKHNNTSLSQDLNVVLQEKKHLENTLALVQQQQNHCEQELSHQKNENTKLQTRYKREMNAHQQKNVQLQTKLLNAETQVRELQKQLKDAQNLNIQWQTQCQTSQDELESLQVRTNRLGGTRLMTEEERYTYDQTIKSLEEQVQHFKHKAERLDSELQTARFSQITIQKEPQLPVETLELQEIKQHLEKAKKESHYKSKTIDSLNKRVSDHEMLISNLGLEIDDLKRQLREKK